MDNLMNNEVYLFFIKVVECTTIQKRIFIYNYEYDEYELTPIGVNGTIREISPNESFPLNYIDINVYEYEKINNS